MIPSIQNIQSTTNFKGTVPKFKGKTKFLDKFLRSQENLSHTRFIQGTLTNWFPKAALSRSFIDFSEFTFLEFIESGIFYFAAPLPPFLHLLDGRIIFFKNKLYFWKCVHKNFYTLWIKLSAGPFL